MSSYFHICVWRERKTDIQADLDRQTNRQRKRELKLIDNQVDLSLCQFILHLFY